MKKKIKHVIYRTFYYSSMLFLLVLMINFSSYANASNPQSNNKQVLEGRQQPNLINRILSKIGGYVTPKMFGAKGDGINDDTFSIQQAINYAAKHNIGTVRIPSGIYNINVSGHTAEGDVLFIDGESHYFNTIGAGILMKSNISLLLDKNAELKAIPNDNKEYAIIYVGEQKNALIKGGKIIGDRFEHLGTQGEHGMCLWIQSSSNITIEDCDISLGWGDCIEIGCKWNKEIDSGSNRSKQIRVINCTLSDSRRQGISVVGCDGLFVKDCSIFNISGTLPQAGVDLEVNNQYYPNLNCSFENVSIYDCKGGGIIGYTTPSHNVQIKNSEIQSINLVCVDKIYIDNSTINYVTLGNYYDANNDSIQISFTKIKNLTLYSEGQYYLGMNNCDIGRDQNQPAVAIVKREGFQNKKDVLSLVFNNCAFTAANDMNLFSIPQSVRPYSMLFEKCIFSPLKRTAITARNVSVNNSILNGNSLTIDFYVPNVSIINNRIETEACKSNIYGYLLKFFSADSVNFARNIIIGEKKEKQCIVVPEGFAPVCEIIDNTARQYDTIGSFGKQVKLNKNNNKLKEAEE